MFPPPVVCGSVIGNRSLVGANGCGPLPAEAGLSSQRLGGRCCCLFRSIDRLMTHVGEKSTRERVDAEAGPSSDCPAGRRCGGSFEELGRGVEIGCAWHVS